MLILPALTLLLPLILACLLLLRYSFDGSDLGQQTIATWTVKNYKTVLGDPFYLGVLANTFKIGAIVTLAALFLSYPVAYVIARSRHQKLLVLLVVIPLWMDALVRSYGWIILLSQAGPVNSLLINLHIVNDPIKMIATPLAVILILLHETVPFMILMLASIIQRIDPSLREAAMNLGASPGVAFRRVTLPLSAAGALASTILTFSLAISAFVGPLILGGYRVPIMSIIINQQMTFALNWPLGSAEAVLLTLTVLGLLYTYSVVLRKFQAGKAGKLMPIINPDEVLVS